MMKKLVKRIGKHNSDLDELLFFHYVALGFSGFLRIDELLFAKLKDIQIKETYATVAVTKSKTYQHRVEDVIYIAMIRLECCLVMHLDN